MPLSGLGCILTQTEIMFKIRIFCFFLPNQVQSCNLWTFQGVKRTKFSKFILYQRCNSIKFSKLAYTFVAFHKNVFCAAEGQEWTVSSTTATVQYIMTKILQKYSNFSFYKTVYSAHNENKIQYPEIDMRIGEPLVWIKPHFYCKKFSSDNYHLFIRAGFAIPEGTLLSSFHCIINLHCADIVCLCSMDLFPVQRIN